MTMHLLRRVLTGETDDLRLPGEVAAYGAARERRRPVNGGGA